MKSVITSVPALFQTWKPYALNRFWAALTGKRGAVIDSVVIPCVGESFAAEASWAARFARRSLHKDAEIIIYTDQPRTAFPDIDDTIKVETVDLPPCDRQSYRQVWQSRIIKIRAPLTASGKCIMLMDSDIMLVKPLQVKAVSGCMYGSFRRGGVGRIARRVAYRYPRASETIRGSVRWHLNGGMLIALRRTWEKLSPHWEAVYREIWADESDEGSPSDQLPLALSLEDLNIHSVDIGQKPNWSVAKHYNYIREHRKLPHKVIGVHGGFPLTEWEKYWNNPTTDLNFHIDGMPEKRYKK